MYRLSISSQILRSNSFGKPVNRKAAAPPPEAAGFGAAFGALLSFFHINPYSLRLIHINCTVFIQLADY
jgi:hypothetical protein